MLNALSVSVDGDPAALERASRSLLRQGFVAARQLQWQDCRLQAWARPEQADTADAWVQEAAGEACCIGPLWYRSRYGADALRQLLDEIESPAQIDDDALRGNFALFLRKRDQAWLFSDALGFVRLYRSDDGRFFSTSWLAVRAYGGNARLNEAAAIEYVLLGATHAYDTPVRNVHRLPIGHLVELRPLRVVARLSADAWRTDDTPASFDDAVDAMASHLRGVFAEIAAAFPQRVGAALSGGFDSRLIVAGLLANGLQPALFVYGDAASEDVPIAEQVARAEGLPLKVVDKSELNRRFAPPDVDELVRSALFFDGLPNDGILDPGADRATRLEQSAAGRLALNGGGGEIFRNFFHLRDHRFRAADIVSAFYRGFDPGVFRGATTLHAYRQRLAAEIARSVGAGNADQALTRRQVELVYPLFRCHHWMGLNNSVAVRHGAFCTPLVDFSTVRAAAALPLRWKDAGRFESSLMTRLHAGIAAHPSAYGFRFSDGPDRKAWWTEWSTGMRPTFARPWINALRRRLQHAQVSPSLVGRLRAMLPGEWALDAVLDVARLPDDTAFARAASIEVVSRSL